MALATDILWPYCNSVTEIFVCQVYRVFVIFVIVCSTMSVAQTIRIVTKQVGSGLTCVQHFVQILAGIQTVVAEVFH
jgi:hypothetical protein